MAIKIIVNDVWKLAAQLAVTDSSNNLTTDVDGLYAVTGGPRHLYWKQSGTAERRIYYANTAGNIACDTLVMTRADLHVGHQIQILSSTAFLSTTSTEYDSGTNFNPTLVGKRSQDWVKEGLSISGKEAVAVRFMDGTAGAYQKEVHQLYFGTALTLSALRRVTTRPTEKDFRFLTKENQSYRVSESGTLEFEAVDSDTLTSLQALWRLREEPFFIYDDDGYWLDGKLWHCVLREPAISKAFDDFHNLQLDVLRLQTYE